ncbi:hypothetical protein ACLQ2P_04195 [Actinomadura citrea]|uniref:hypothetical protein n=1 Tax=Actinomadura citrea TaxID=46158 RepID=UPI003CE48FD5
MANTTPAQPAEGSTPDPRRSYVSGEQAYQRERIEELDQAVANGEVNPEDLPEPPPLSWT